MKKRLLVYAHYFYPDVASTGQLLTELCGGMQKDFDITVICVVPSYLGKVDDKYKTKRLYKEKYKNINIIRVRVPEFSKGNKISRVKNIVAYFLNAIIATFKVGKQDIVFSISQPPILGGILGVIGKTIKKSKFVYNIQDFNPEQIMAVHYTGNKFILKLAMMLDKYSCKRADKVIVVGRDMQETLKSRFNNKEVSYNVFINNWINEREICPLLTNNEKVLAFRKKHGLIGKLVFMYSGNIGLYYDLENLIKVINKFKNNKNIAFVFVGEGCIKEELIHYKLVHHIENIVFIPYQDKSNLIFSLNAADVHWCVNAKDMKGISVPSKLYGIMAVGKPVLGVLNKGSEARLIIEESNCGLVCEPGDYEAIEKNIQCFIDNADMDNFKKMGIRGREYLVKHLTKEVSIKKYIDEIKSC